MTLQLKDEERNGKENLKKKKTKLSKGVYAI